MSIGARGALCPRRVAGASCMRLRGLLALIVLAVCAKIGFDLVMTPDDLYNIGFTGGH